MNKKIDMPLKVAFLASIGSGLEYYDFVIYLFLSKWLSIAFFPVKAHSAAILETLGIFFLGALARPLGSYFMGIYADRHGRRSSYFIILTLMTVSTLAIALAPTYATVGILAPVLLVILRLMQSVGFGSDLPVGVVLLAEHAPKHRKSWYCSLLIMNVAFGSTLGTGISFLLTHYLNPVQMQNYGWRLAFLIGVVLNLVAFLFRRKIHETPVFTNFKNKLKTTKLFKIDYKKCIYAGALILFPGALVMLQTTFPINLPTLYHISAAKIYYYLTIFGLLEALLIPIFSLLSDIWRRQWFYITSIIVWLAIMPLSFYFCLHQPTPAKLIWFFACYTLAIGLLAGSFFVLLVEAFPISGRVSQYALTYNTVYLIMAGVPLFTTWLATKHIWLEGVLASLVILAVIAIISSARTSLSTEQINARWNKIH